MKRKHWLFFASAVICALHLNACSSAFDACSASRSCAPLGGSSDAGAAGSEAGASENSGGDGGAAGETASNAGTGGESEAGASGEAGAPPIACDATLSACGNACLDLKVDPKNCGKCGHDCLGGECDLGICQPVAMVPPDGYINDLIPIGDYLFWSGCNAPYSDCFVARRRIDGSDMPKIVADNQGGELDGLAASSTDVLWLANGHVRACALPDCSAGARDLVPETTGSLGSVTFAKSTQTFFWSALTADSKETEVSYFKLSSAAPATVGSASASAFIRLVSDEQNVYWLTPSTFTGTSTTPNADGAIWRARLTDFELAPLASGFAGRLQRLAVGPDALYLSDRLDSKGPDGVLNAIFRVPLPNGLGLGALPEFARVSQDPNNGDSVGGMTTDGVNLYWSDNNLRTIQRCPLSGCVTPEILAVGQEYAGALNGDTASLYWATVSASFQGIDRVAK